jgi:hypothetical protein
MLSFKRYQSTVKEVLIGSYLHLILTISGVTWGGGAKPPPHQSHALPLRRAISFVLGFLELNFYLLFG